ncbi:hypothetical protein FHS04_002794 [Mesoflavibacter sabulilitoris]|uniref:Uncharacterized protein n=1 Tax=Mesoflavibacter zeaxanthinifaciens subsp. sabulilitoris TaxID=1520893 RepID=A0A2T1NNN1_9FLAO|nr:hypothetical protein [Mesoflavibacter zeaxanthinifaciens]MBB3125250.1 hypothetical protein [Mesoflavibacter zeaxanthinifaciens subsp. sabulilitoris]PSG94485.1 hypothetical protein C7H61_00700 [Mesoflavibacter zeaxanthinifaciens subsp. sabulilitoris]
MVVKDSFVLLTDQNTYFVEYLLGELILSQSINHAMVFNEKEIAIKFQKMLYQVCDLNCSVNTYL